MSHSTSTTSGQGANILVFDSGLGGLSIVAHLREQLPAAAISYLADSAYFPYGLRTEAELVARVCELIQAFVHEHPCDLVIIACNSASTLVLPALRARLPQPIVGVVPAIKPAAALSRNKVLGLLATAGTIEREYTDELIQSFARDCRIVRVGASALVELVERKMRGFPPCPEQLSVLLRDLQPGQNEPAPDTVVLACTHFPLAREELAKALPHVQHWVDSGAAIARRAAALLSGKHFDNSPQDHNNKAFFTSEQSLSQDFARILENYGFSTSSTWQPALIAS